MKRVLVVMDISNLFYCTRKIFDGARINYEKLLIQCVDDGEVLHRAIAYGASMGDEAVNFIHFLKKIGFETKYKEPKIFGRDFRGKEIRKADWDVGIAIDVVKILPNVDVVVFGTADGDMAACVEYVINCGKEARVIGCQISRELKDTCNEFQEIGSHLLLATEQVTDEADKSMELRPDSTSNAVESPEPSSIPGPSDSENRA